MALAFRLDAAPDALNSEVRLRALKEILHFPLAAHFVVEEQKASGQIHWQAILYPPHMPSQSYRDFFRLTLQCRKTEYSVVNAPKPAGFESYLCKGPTSTRGVLPIVLQHYGVKYTPEFFTTQHHQWFINGESMRTRTTPEQSKNLLQICEDRILSRQAPVTLRACMWTVWSIVQAQRKMMSRHQIVWTGSQLYCIFNPEANLNMFNNCYMDAAQEFSETNIGTATEVAALSPYYLELPENGGSIQAQGAHSSSGETPEVSEDHRQAQDAQDQEALDHPRF